MQPQSANGDCSAAAEFVTVVNVQPSIQPSESFVTVLSIGASAVGAGGGDKQPRPQDKDGNGDGKADPAHPEEKVDVFRLPGERLGFGLKFEGGNKTSEKVRRLFIQSCAEQSPASRAKCSWGNLGEGDEVLTIDGTPVTQMTRLDCVRRLKESQLILKLAVRYRGALRPEVVSAERKLSGQLVEQQRNKVPPELPAAPPPVPPRKLRHSGQSAANRGPADGEASPGTKQAWDSPKSGGSSQTGSPQSQGSFHSAASSIRSSNYESCTSSPVKSSQASKNGSPKGLPKSHASPVLSKTKQEPPAGAQSYLDARSQDGSSTHGSTSDDTSSSLSTVVDRFSSSDRFSTTSTTSTTSEKLLFSELSNNHSEMHFNGDDNLLDLGNPANFLLTRLAHSEARTHVESRGDVERVTAVVAPNTVLIEETPALQPPISFQDAPLSYGHEPRPGIFYSVDLAADSRTHFRPIKDDADVVKKVFNGKMKEEDSCPPALPVRNHVNRISVNQQQLQVKKDAEEEATTLALPPKPMPRKDIKAKRKRPPPPPPPPPARCEAPPPVPEARTLLNKRRDEEDNAETVNTDTNEKIEIVNGERDNGNVETIAEVEVEHVSEIEPAVKTDNKITQEQNMAQQTNKIIDVVETKEEETLSSPKPLSRTSNKFEVSERESKTSEDDDTDNANDSKLENSENEKLLADTKGSTNTISIELEDGSEDERIKIDIEELVDNTETDMNSKEQEVEEKEVFQNEVEDDDVQQITDDEEEGTQLIATIRKDERDFIDEEDLTDESEEEDYYWQSNLATIGEEEENNFLEYENANEDPPAPPAVQNSVQKPAENPQIVESVAENFVETLDENARDSADCMRRIVRNSGTEDKKQDKSALNVRMDNCGGGGQRLPPDGDEFPTAYQEFISPSQQYQYVTARETMAANGDVDRGESILDGTSFLTTKKPAILPKTRSIHNSPNKKDPELLDLDSDKKTSVSNYVLYSNQKTVAPPSNLVTEKKIEIASYYLKDSSPKPLDQDEVDGSPPPLPLTGPPKLENCQVRAVSQERKYSTNGELWRQDNKSEKSVKDKIAMFSSQSSDEAPLFPPTAFVSSPSSNNNSRKLSKHKSSDDVFADEKYSPTIVQRTQSSLDLINTGCNHHQKMPSLPTSSPPLCSGGYNGYSNNNSLSYIQKMPHDCINKESLSNMKANGYLNSYSTSCNGGFTISQSSLNKSFDDTLSSSPLCSPTKSVNGLMRATSFSGSSSPYGHERLQSPVELLGSSTISRTNSLASTFRRPNEDMRKNSLNQLIEQRRKGISKLRGLIIPEKDTVPVDQPIIDLPEIKSRDLISVNQVPRSNVQDKWGSQSSLASNASTVSSSMRSNTQFKMPAPKILSSYSPAFKRKSLTAYNNNSQSVISSPISNSKSNSNNTQLSSPASDAPKSLESICSPTRSDYSFEFISSSGSPDNQLTPPKPTQHNYQRKGGRNEYDDSDNDSAVSSSQSSISRGFSPPMSPVPSERSTMSSDRSYLSSEVSYPRPHLIIESPVNKSMNGTTIPADKSIYNIRSNFINERNHSVPDKPLRSKPIQQQTQTFESVRSSQIPQRQIIKRSSSTDTNSSNSSTSTLTSGSQASAESLSRRVLKPQSVEAINRKNILASARCRSGRDMNGSPLIQRKFSDDEETAVTPHENGGFINVTRNGSGKINSIKPEIKIAYIEVTENAVADEEKYSNQKEEEQPPRLPSKRYIIPQTKTVPIPTTRSSKSDTLEQSSDMKSWVRAELRTMIGVNIEKANSFDECKEPFLYGSEKPSPSIRHFNKSKSSLAINEQSTIDEQAVDLAAKDKSKSRSSLSLKKDIGDQSDLLTVLTTKTRSRSAIHVEDASYGNLKTQMSLEDILVAKTSDSSKLPRSQIVNSENGTSNRAPTNGWMRRSNSIDCWAEERIFPSKIPAPSRASKPTDYLEEEISEHDKLALTGCSKIPMPRNLSRRSASVTDMKKVFEKPELSQSSENSPSGGLMMNGNGVSHNRFPSLDSSVEENIRPVGSYEIDQERFNGEQFGSISSLASSTSLISQQELAQLVEEANLEEPRGGHDVAVVLLHKENPSGNVGITLAGGIDCETKEITIHRVLAHSIADREGSVLRGDRILSINGRSMRGLTHRESLAVLKQPRAELVLVVSRAKPEDGGGTAATTMTTTTVNGKLRGRTESVETIVEGYEAYQQSGYGSGGSAAPENTAWGPPASVAIYKDGAGLGFSLEGGRDSPLGDRPLLIKKIFTGGAAEKTGVLRAGDQLLEVNKRDVSRMSRIEAWSLMKKLPDGEVNLLVRHPATKSS